MRTMQKERARIKNYNNLVLLIKKQTENKLDLVGQGQRFYFSILCIRLEQGCKKKNKGCNVLHELGFLYYF